jgi:hypothetical protein
MSGVLKIVKRLNVFALKCRDNVMIPKTIYRETLWNSLMFSLVLLNSTIDCEAEFCILKVPISHHGPQCGCTERALDR